MRVDVVDFGCLNVGTAERLFHRAARSASGRIRLGKVMVVRRESVADYLPEDIRAARLRGFEVLQRENRRAFAEHQTAALAVEGSAFLRRCRLQRIEADEDELRDSVVASGQ